MATPTRKRAPKRSAADFLPRVRTLSSLREAAQSCEGCPLFAQGSQTVFGEGPDRAEILLIGENPGEVEDRLGRPFVGPAGQLLNRLLQRAGLPRARLYLTNAVKHFKWKAVDSRRSHVRPGFGEMDACRPWLEAEIAALRPSLIVCLGAVAAQTVFGRDAKVGTHRGQFMPTEWGIEAFVTIHPSAILRIPDPEAQARAEDAFVADLRRIQAHVQKVAA